MPESPTAIRFPPELIARFERIAETLSERNAGMKVTRSDAVRMAAERGATSLEEELGIKPPKPKPKRK